MPGMRMSLFKVLMLALPVYIMALSRFHRRAIQQAPLVLAHRQERLANLRLGSTAAVEAEGQHEQGGQSSPSSNGGANSGMAASTFNVIKNIVGAGMLSLPAGVAAFSDNKGALLPATLLVVAFGAVSAYTFSLLGKITRLTEAESYEDAWAKAIGPGTAWLVNLSLTFTCIFSCLAYAIIIGESFMPLFQNLGLPALLSSRQGVIISLSAVVLLPLCLLRDLSALAFTSILGIAGTVYAVLAIVLRSVDGSYAAGGKFLTDALAAKPSFGVTGGSVFSPKSFVLLSMLGTAYNAHFNAPRFFLQLKDATLKRFDAVAWRSFIASTVLYSAVMIGGFLTFGGSSMGLILSNYNAGDSLLNVCRTAIGVSILFSYPLNFVGARDGILTLLTRGQRPSEAQRVGVILGLLSIITAIACKLTDVGVVVSFGGAVLGSAIIYIFPGLLHLAAQRKQIRTGELNLGTSRWGRFSLLGNYALVVMGGALGVIGGVVSILAARGIM